MSQTWTVYTVEQVPASDAAPEMFNIVKTRWNENGPDETTKRIAKVLTGVTAEEAAKRAQDMQAGYDGIRRGMAEA